MAHGRKKKKVDGKKKKKKVDRHENLDRWAARDRFWLELGKRRDKAFQDLAQEPLRAFIAHVEDKAGDTPTLEETEAVWRGWQSRWNLQVPRENGGTDWMLEFHIPWQLHRWSVAHIKVGDPLLVEPPHLEIRMLRGDGPWETKQLRSVLPAADGQVPLSTPRNIFLSVLKGTGILRLSDLISSVPEHERFEHSVTVDVVSAWHINFDETRSEAKNRILNHLRNEFKARLEELANTDLRAYLDSTEASFLGGPLTNQRKSFEPSAFAWLVERVVPEDSGGGFKKWEEVFPGETTETCASKCPDASWIGKEARRLGLFIGLCTGGHGARG